jgi:hypothetical protein
VYCQRVVRSWIKKIKSLNPNIKDARNLKKNTSGARSDLELGVGILNRTIINRRANLKITSYYVTLNTESLNNHW